eukprot:TRINITY_DN14975_c0_g1_i1.p1 TRINITY_DN14975_c0_g1~~TRINITY_DN14975_c0_g1_i1.p1  ORF type:complete len:586 (-),score=222.95 TRINITY_DN14975_c0_g1_i1:96-1853(-)
MSRTPGRRKSSGNVGEEALEEIREEESPARSLRKRKAVDPPEETSSRSRRNSSVKASTIPDLEEIKESDEMETDENDEAFARSSVLNEEQDGIGKDMFGFQTPKKAGSMAQKVAEVMNRTPLSVKNTPLSGRKVTPSKSLKSTPNKTVPSTPTTPRGILKTPTSRKKARLEPDTPASARKRVKKTLIRIAETETTHNYSDNSESDEDGTNTLSDDEDDDDKHIIRGPPATPRTPARRGRKGKQGRELDQLQIAESYFSAHSEKVLTSDRTLAKLKTPRLSDAEVTKLLSGSKLTYEAEVRELIEDHRVQFPKWLSLLHRGYSVVCYGLGSKKSLLHDFHENLLLDKDCVVVNGFFPSLTIKQILGTITEDILEIEGNFSSTSEHLEEIFSCLTTDLYLLVHNIDGSTLRTSKVQSTLASLASHPLVHLVCSIDHINAPLIWDQQCLSKLNLIWFDCTTFLPYMEEAGGADSLMVRKTGQLALASLGSVWASLTPNAKKIYIIIIKYQIENMEESDNYHGFSFMELYRLCRAEFLVASDLALRAQLTEFRDHKLVKSKKGSDGGEYLTIPLDKPTMSAFLENIDEK